MNLHGIVRGAITAVSRDKDVTLYQSTGQYSRQERGNMSQVFVEIPDLKAQFQSLSTDQIQAFDGIEITATTRRVYLYADVGTGQPPFTAFRPLGRSGDYLKDDLGKWWLVNGVIEDFTHEGWCCLLCTLQTAAPTITIKELEDGDTSTKP